MHATRVAVTFTRVSRNDKTGPIPVSTTDRHSCPDTCPFLGRGCYFDQHHNKVFWTRMTEVGPNASFPHGRNGTAKTLDWGGLCRSVAALPDLQLWRHNQGGDMPHKNGRMNRAMARKLARANRGRRGFTFSHHDVLDGPHAAHNREVIAECNAAGFAVNLSANNLADCDRKLALGIGPVAVTLPSSVHGRQDIFTPAGTRVVVCPATYRDDTACIDCGLCQRIKRAVAVGFPGHGGGKRYIDAVATL